MEIVPGIAVELPRRRYFYVDIATAGLRHRLMTGSPRVVSKAGIGYTNPFPAERCALIDMKRFHGVTIDSETSRDLDDAIHVEPDGSGWRVTVAVADVSSAVQAGSPEDMTARAAGATHYGGTRLLRPMLAESQDKVSLLPGEARRAVGIVLRLDANLSVLDTDVGRGMFESSARLSHGQAVTMLQGGSTPLHAMMRDAWKLATGLLARRQSAGALAFFSPDAGILSDEEGHLVDLGLRGGEARAYIIVQELMILANQAVAELCVRREAPILFRNHRGSAMADRAALTEDIAIAASGGAMAAAAGGRLDLMLGRANLGTRALGHFALNLPVYAWFTSPIRRYADLVNHRMLMAKLEGAPAPHTQQEPDSAFKKVIQCERIAKIRSPQNGL